MSLYGDYIKERESYQIMEDERGFATFAFNNHECYIRDVYIKPEFRKEGVAKHFVDSIETIAKAAGCKKMIGSVDASMRGADASLKFVLGCGYKFRSTCGPNGIFLEKEIV